MNMIRTRSSHSWIQKISSEIVPSTGPNFERMILHIEIARFVCITIAYCTLILWDPAKCLWWNNHGIASLPRYQNHYNGEFMVSIKRLLPELVWYVDLSTKEECKTQRLLDRLLSLIASFFPLQYQITHLMFERVSWFMTVTESV